MRFPAHKHLRDDLQHHALHLLDCKGAERGDENSVSERPVVLPGKGGEETIARKVSYLWVSHEQSEILTSWSGALMTF